MELCLNNSILHLVVVPGGRYAGDLVMSSRIFLHLKFHVILHVMLAQHGVSARPWCDLLHPVLIFAFHLAVIVNLATGWKHGQLCAIYDISDTGFSLLAVFFFDRLVILHLAFEVAEILDIFLLVGGLLDFHCEDQVSSITLLQSILDLLDQVDLLFLHLSHLVIQYKCLPLVLFHVALNIVLASNPILVQKDLLAIYPLFVELELTFLFAHLVGQLLEHLDLLSGLVVHDLRLLGELGSVALLGVLTATGVVARFLEIHHTVIFDVILVLMRPKHILFLGSMRVSDLAFEISLVLV